MFCVASIGTIHFSNDFSSTVFVMSTGTSSRRKLARCSPCRNMSTSRSVCRRSSRSARRRQQAPPGTPSARHSRAHPRCGPSLRNAVSPSPHVRGKRGQTHVVDGSVGVRALDDIGGAGAGSKEGGNDDEEGAEHDAMCWWAGNSSACDRPFYPLVCYRGVYRGLRPAGDVCRREAQIGSINVYRHAL
jgi:hypothetical protein